MWIRRPTRQSPKTSSAWLGALLLLLMAATAHAQSEKTSSGLGASSRSTFGLELSVSPELSAHFELATRLTPLTPLPPQSLGGELGPRTILLDRVGFAMLGCLGSPALRVCAGPELTGTYARGRDFSQETASLLGNLDAGLRFDVRMYLAPRWVLTASALLLLASLTTPAQPSMLFDNQRALVQLWLGISYEF